MKKVSVLFTLLTTCFILNAQIAGRKSKDAITILDSIIVNPGDTIYLGKGSDTRGAFEYIYQPLNGWVGSPEQSLNRSFANTHAVIKHFKNQKTRRSGQKVVGVVNFGGFNCVVDLEPAIDAGEVVAINGRNFRKEALLTKEVNTPTTQVNIQQQPLSKADELTKLKALLDNGTLTQEEYNAEKKKILDKP